MQVMIRVPLTFHSPEFVYQFLRNNVGPLYMALKHNQAIIHFAKAGHSDLALAKYKNTILNNFPLQLLPYQEGDLDRPQSQSQPQPQPPSQPAESAMQEERKQANEVTLPPSELSKFTMQIEAMLKVGDPNDLMEKVTRASKEDVIKFVSSYNTLFETAVNKRKDIMGQPEGQEQKMRDFTKFYERGLQQLAASMKQEFKKFRRRCAGFGVQENVEVDPSIEIVRTTRPKASRSQSYRTNVQYINKFVGLKRVAALNEKQFVCTSFSPPQKGRLLLFKADDEYMQMSQQVNDGAYGLLVLDHHILVGNSTGKIGFFTSPEFNKLELSPQAHGTNSLVFQIVENSFRPGGYNIMTLGSDNLLKLWDVREDAYAPGASTLFFEESLTICHHNKQIPSVDVLSKGHRIVFAAENNLLLHDCVSGVGVSSIELKGTIMKVSALDENNIGVANKNYLSFVDIRNRANTINCNLGKDIRTLTAVSPTSVVYGCADGEVGMMDRRISKCLWRNTTNHQHQIYDVCHIGDMLLTADNRGQIVSWNPNYPPPPQ